MQVQVHLLPSLIPAGALRGGVAVVVDILRATTAMVHALDSGVEMIRPCVGVEEALDLATSIGRDRTLLGGERQGVVIPGFLLGNSPTSYTPEVCKNKTLVMTTTNGTRAIHASLEAERVLIGAFVNLEATIREIGWTASTLHLVCSGTNDRVSLEDSLFAGAFIAGLRAVGRSMSNDKAIVLEDEGVLLETAWRSMARSSTLKSQLALGRGGRRVLELGYDVDIAAAATLNQFDFAAEIHRDPVRIVRA